MKREPVDSEAMRSVGYDRRRHILEIEFGRGSVYRYLGVPAPVHDALRDAASLGAYFSEHIRDAGYLVERVDEVPSAAGSGGPPGAAADPADIDASAAAACPAGEQETREAGHRIGPSLGWAVPERPPPHSH